MRDDPRFELRKLTNEEWLILDHRFSATDARHTVACLRQQPHEGVEVVWLRALSLQRHFEDAARVLEVVHHAHPPDD
jgi:hypothetical protein